MPQAQQNSYSTHPGPYHQQPPPPMNPAFNNPLPLPGMSDPFPRSLSPEPFPSGPLSSRPPVPVPIFTEAISLRPLSPKTRP